MNFKLNSFAKNEIRDYKLIRNTGYSLDNPQGIDEEFIYPMLIYKKSLKVLTPNQDGIRILNQLNGKCLKKYDVRIHDIIIIQELKYRVVEILPRLYADFKEFSLELIKDEEQRD